MIELIVYPKPPDRKLVSFSPFCAKTEIFLKLAKVDFKINEFNGNPGKFPKKKLPVIKYNNHLLADSYFIQRFLEKEMGIDLDSHLSPYEKAQGFAFVKMAEEFLYWSLLHERWFIDENWRKLRDDYFGHIPKPIRGLITGLVRSSTKKSAIGHGMSRHADEDIHELGRQAVTALADFLQEKKYLLGDKVSSYDATIYAFVASLLHSPLGPKLKEETRKHANLVAYDQRMFKEVYQS